MLTGGDKKKGFFLLLYFGKKIVEKNMSVQNIILSRVREYMIYDTFSDKEYLDLGVGGGRIQRAQKPLSSTFNPIDKPLVGSGTKFP
jgi:hypothetical protein